MWNRYNRNGGAASLNPAEFERPAHNLAARTRHGTEIVCNRVYEPDFPTRAWRAEALPPIPKSPPPRPVASHARDGSASAGLGGYYYCGRLSAWAVRSGPGHSQVPSILREDFPRPHFFSPRGLENLGANYKLLCRNSKTASATAGQLSRTTKLFEAPACDVPMITLSIV